jgi:hypothetical protein
LYFGSLIVLTVSIGLPFTLDVSSENINLHNARLYAKLYYDSDFDEDFKPVDYVKVEPMTYKVFISAGGDRATIECRIFVLTSQHEDSLFRVKAGCVFGSNPALEVTSEPIRVVSKPSQVHKEKRKRAGVVTTAPSTPIAPSSPSVASITGKRKENDLVMETLYRMEEQQRQQRAIIEQLLLQRPAATTSKESDDDFESLFQKFLGAYAKLPADERPTKVRKVLAEVAPTHTDALAEFITLCASPDNGIHSKMPLSLSQILESIDIPSISSTDGTSKKEEEAWDNLYSELTWSPESDNKEIDTH